MSYLIKKLTYYKLDVKKLNMVSMGVKFDINQGISHPIYTAIHRNVFDQVWFVSKELDINKKRLYHASVGNAAETQTNKENI